VKKGIARKIKLKQREKVGMDEMNGRKKKISHLNKIYKEVVGSPS